MHSIDNDIEKLLKEAQEKATFSTEVGEVEKELLERQEYVEEKIRQRDEGGAVNS